MEKKVIQNQVVKNVQMKRTTIPVVDVEAHRPFIECMVLATNDDPRLKEFFSVLEKEIEAVIRSKGISYEKQERQIAELVESFYQKRQVISSKLKASGIKFVENFLGPSYTLHGFDDSFERREFDYALIFNGLMLSKDELLNPDKAPFEADYEKALKQVAEMDEESEEIKRTLKRPSVIFGSRKTYKDLRSRLSYLKSHRNYADIAKRKLDTFNGFTAEQRDLLIQYFETTEAIDKGVRSMNESQKESRKVAPEKTDLTIMDEALTRMVNGGMTEEDLSEIFRRIDNVMANRESGLYDRRERVSLSSLTVMKTFLKEIYGTSPRQKETRERLIDE